MSQYLQEAFTKLTLLEEEDFNLSDTLEIDDMKSFMDDNEEIIDFEDVIDPEAKTEEDLEDSYIGKVILDCTVCHSKIYKNAEEVHYDEETDLANVDEECPFCYSMDGFEIVGQVAPYEETEIDVEVEPKDEEDDTEVEDEDSIEIETTGEKGMKAAEAAMDTFKNESFKRKNRKNKSRLFKESYDSDGWESDDATTAPERSLNRMLKDVEDTSYQAADADFEANADLLKDIPTADISSLNKRKKLKTEALENVDIETEHDKIHVSSEEKNDFDGEEVIAPVEPAQEADILADDEEEMPDMGEEETDFSEEEPDMGEEEEVDYDLEDFDEEPFDTMGESYLKRVYDNVKSFKTSSVRAKGNNLFIEGVIKFNSGKNKATTFKFEAKDCTKNHKVRFIGENLQISRGKKSFTLRGTMDKNKFIPESLNYNYRVNGTRVYGTEKSTKLNESLKTIITNKRNKSKKK